MRKVIHHLGIILTALLLGGCMGYQLGGGRPDGVDSVYMAPVLNQSGEPAIELQVTHALRDRIQFDGRMKLLNERNDADAVIEVILSSYQLTPIAYRKDLDTTPERYRMRINATATLKNTRTGETISKSDSYGETIFLFESDLTTSKRNALPEAAHDLAKYLVDDLIEMWH
jgi:hypothetical protein